MLPASLPSYSPTSSLTGSPIQTPNPLHSHRHQNPRTALVTRTRAATSAATLYDELGLRAGATSDEIKAAYRLLARERHPDVAPQPAAIDPESDPDPGDFIRLHDAYATLSDPDKRAEYDRAMRLTGGPHHVRSPSRRRWETDQCW